MDFFNQSGKIIFKIFGVLFLLPICFIGGCATIGVVGNTLQEVARTSLEFRNPGHTIRIVDDNPVIVSVSLEGQYMYRIYGYSIKSKGVSQNLITGETTVLSETAVNNLLDSGHSWLSDSLFVDLASWCIYSATQPDVCAIPLQGHLGIFGEPQDNYSIEFIIENSDSIIVLQEQSQIFGFTQDAQSKPIAYTTRCNEDCRRMLKQMETDNITIITPVNKRLSFDEQHYSTNCCGCLTLSENNTEEQVAEICKGNFFPSDRIRALGWNTANDGFYFHVDFDGGKGGDVFLLPIP